MTPLTHTVPILQSWFLLLIFKLTFKGVSQCMYTVGVLYFGLLNPFEYSLLPPAVFNTHPYILYPHILYYSILLKLYHSHFLSLFP
jgi:hypothetical protein